MCRHYQSLPIYPSYRSNWWSDHVHCIFFYSIDRLRGPTFLWIYHLLYLSNICHWDGRTSLWSSCHDQLKWWYIFLTWHQILVFSYLWILSLWSLSLSSRFPLLPFLACLYLFRWKCLFHFLPLAFPLPAFRQQFHHVAFSFLVPIISSNWQLFLLQ